MANSYLSAHPTDALTQVVELTGDGFRQRREEAWNEHGCY